MTEDVTVVECKVFHEFPKELADKLYAIERSAHQAPWTYEGLIDSFLGNTVIGCLADGNVVGFAVMQTVWDEAELLTIGVLPEFQGRGLGKRLLAASLAEVKKHGALKCFLEVRVSNVRALLMYEKAGFKKIGVRKNYYAKTASLPAEDAFAMAAEL